MNCQDIFVKLCALENYLDFDYDFFGQHFFDAKYENYLNEIICDIKNYVDARIKYRAIYMINICVMESRLRAIGNPYLTKKHTIWCFKECVKEQLWMKVITLMIMSMLHLN
jgi:hypothetical protein